MTQKGVVGLTTVDGTPINVAVYEPGTFSFEPFRVVCENGYGVFNLVDPANADTALRIVTESHGPMAINAGDIASRSIDDFEHNSLQSYYGVADTANPPEIRASAARSGTYGLYGYSDSRAMSLPQGHPNFNSSVQSQFLDNYPSSGDVFEFYVYVSGFISGGNAINRYHFGKQDYEEGDNGYRIWWTFNDNYWRLEKYTGGNQDTLVDARISNNWPTGQWLRGVIDWRGTGWSATMYRANGTQIDSLSTNDTTYTSGGVGYDNGQYCISYTDDWRLINSP